jgi:hypothetical protein
MLPILGLLPEEADIAVDTTERLYNNTQSSPQIIITVYSETSAAVLASHLLNFSPGSIILNTTMDDCE